MTLFVQPAGVPVVDEEGGVGTVGGLMGGFRCGHRLDVCVSGVLIMAKGSGTQGSKTRTKKVSLIFFSLCSKTDSNLESHWKS
jgi:hypothetical protein